MPLFMTSSGKQRFRSNFDPPGALGSVFAYNMEFVGSACYKEAKANRGFQQENGTHMCTAPGDDKQPGCAPSA